MKATVSKDIEVIPVGFIKEIEEAFVEEHQNNPDDKLLGYCNVIQMILHQWEVNGNGWIKERILNETD